MPDGPFRFQVPMLSRFTVPPLRSVSTSRVAVGRVGDVELVAVRVPAEVRQRVEDQDPLVGPKRSW